MKEFKESIPLSFYYKTHCRIYKQSFRGMISREQLNVVLRMHYNIPKDDCPQILKELEILGLLKPENGIVKVTQPEMTEEEFNLKFKKILKLV